MKWLAITAAAFFLLGVSIAEAQRRPNAGYCPAGTCSNTGGSYANNTKNCSAANCKTPRGLGNKKR
jgi:hypothetical protein